MDQVVTPTPSLAAILTEIRQRFDRLDRNVDRILEIVADMHHYVCPPTHDSLDRCITTLRGCNWSDAAIYDLLSHVPISVVTDIMRHGGRDA